MKNFILILITLITIATFQVNYIEAANLTLVAPAAVRTEENINIVVNLDTDGVLINSVELVLEYDTEKLSFSGYSDENAIIKLFIEPPHALNGKIYLSGIIPGGVSGLYDPKNNKTEDVLPLPLVNLFFTPKKSGEVKFSFIESKILKHDGLGTSLVHDAVGTTLQVENNPNHTQSTEEKKNIRQNSLPRDYTYSFVFWTMLIIFISGILMHKLIKYKNGK